MSPRREPKTRLAERRMAAGWTQDQMAVAAGLASATYRRLDQGRVRNPPLRYLQNCAIALGCKLDELIEDEWREWLQRPGGPAKPPFDPPAGR